VDEIDSIIDSADLCLAPLATGAGVKTKVLHYLAHGKRIAGTPIAFEGLSGAPGCSRRHSTASQNSWLVSWQRRRVLRRRSLG